MRVHVYRVPPRIANLKAALILIFIMILFALPVSAQSGTGPTRETEPVVITGSAFPDAIGDEISRLALFRWDATGELFELVPFQIDERLDKVFEAGTSSEITQNLYDVGGEEDGTLDADDELVFLFQDGGPQAPVDAEWPTGAALLRHEISVTNPDLPSDVRWVYLYDLDSWSPPPGYVTWDTGQSSSIVSGVFEMEYTDRWLLLGYRVNAPCGSGADLIDRLKGRAGEPGNVLSENEELWNGTSTWLGGLVGPVRAIRVVRGAASAFNAFHYDIMYENLWQREVILRVHPIGQVSQYLDFLPQTGLTYFANDFPAGLALDGIPNPGVPSDLADWELVRGPGGGLVMLGNVVPSPHVGSWDRYHRDDADFEDGPGAAYPDEDDSAIGNIGIRAWNLTGNATTAIINRIRIYPLCSDVGDGTMGAGFRNLWDVPFTTVVTPEWGTLGAIRTLTNSGDPVELTLSWDAVSGADSYRVYAADSPDLPQASWTLLGETANLFFTDPMDLTTRYYSVAPVADGVEGDW
jgi:hypothetical protein